MNQVFKNTRQLACIMFTDIVGYTALMGSNETSALNTLKINRDIQKPIIASYNGLWIKELGDGVLATFSSVTDAVNAAVEIQLAARKYANFDLRIGLHLSEIIYENGDVFGDGVNIASRIQSSAVVGGIVVSETVKKNLSNKNGIKTNFLASEKLKNVKEAIDLYELEVTDDFVTTYQPRNVTASSNISNERSIAVLPFRNLSSESEQEYFSDGIADEIIITLSSIKDLKVVGRRSSFQFKDSNLPIEQIGATLQVGLLLEGTVRKIGNKVRISVDLVNIKDGKQLWAEKYDRELTDIFEIQDDIANNIAQKLTLTFFGEDTRVFPINMEAYELLLKGRFYVEKYIEGFDKALACFTRAIELDPNYGEAYCELAKLHFLLTMHLLSTPIEGFERVRFYAVKALKINNELGAAHYVLGQCYFWHDWDFVKAKEAYEQAEKCKDSFYFTGVVLDPWYPAFVNGNYDIALQSIYKILETDPLSFYAQLHLGYFLTYSRKKEEAIALFQKMLTFVPTFSEAERLIAYNYIFAKDFENAYTHARKAATLAQGLGWAQNTLIIALVKTNRKEEAVALLKDYEYGKGPLHASNVGIGLVHSYLGDLDTAFDYFDKAIVKKDIWCVAFKYCPDFDHLRNDERFNVLLNRIGFPE
jgi:TolB-like protein/class 3 adenylate cyclase/Tfp pilus assembly protein PilF